MEDEYMTIEEYLERQRQARIAEALAKSYARTMPYTTKWLEDNGFTCIATATNNYYDDPKQIVTGNQTFAGNPEQYGFKKINGNEKQAGDIVQFTGSDGIPYHAVIYTGKKNGEGEELYNYSAGGHDAYSIRKDKTYPQYNGSKRYYRYTGTPEENHRWKREYYKSHPIPDLQPIGAHTITGLPIGQLPEREPVDLPDLKLEPNFFERIFFKTRHGNE